MGALARKSVNSELEKVFLKFNDIIVGIPKI